jgi:hypothetical protein
MKFKQANTHTIQCMGQDISLKSERKTHDLNHDLTFSAHTINCMCHSIRSMFRVLDIYNYVIWTNIGCSGHGVHVTMNHT